MRRKKDTLYYSTAGTFPQRTWAINLTIPRGVVPDLCAQLHAMMHERQGVSYYYPDVPNNRVTCRYEWTRKWRGVAFGIHLGLALQVGAGDLNQILVYATTNEAIGSKDVQALSFSGRILNQLQQESTDIVREAIARLTPGERGERHVVLYIEMPSSCLFERTRTEDNRITIFPSVIAEDKLVSAISITVDATSNESAKPQALRDGAVFCALYTLANAQFCKTTQVKWPRGKPSIQFLDSPDTVDVNILYPRHKRLTFEVDRNVICRSTFVWRLYQTLPEDAKSSFDAALFAYYAGHAVPTCPTLATVAYIAALSSLAKDRRKACSGRVSCSRCGALRRHDSVGDSAAINLLIRDVLKSPQDLEGSLEKLIQRIYSRHRSAFVHGAELRHEEFHRNFGLPGAFPTADGPVRHVFYFREDFVSLGRIVRRVLLEWLSRSAGSALDVNLFNFADERLISKMQVESEIFLPANTVVAPFQTGPEKT